MAVAVTIAGAAALLLLTAGNRWSAPAAGAPFIPLCAGLSIVTAISGKEGDYESIKTIASLDDREVRIKYSSEVMSTDLFETQPTLKRSLIQRTVLVADLANARIYYQRFLDQSASTIPGSTAIGTSAAVLRDLRDKGVATLSVSNAYPGLALGADRSKRPNSYDYLQPGKLARVGAGPVAVSVLVNGEEVAVPAIHARGDFSSDKAEFFFVDDERNPLTLSFRIGIDPARPHGAREILRVVKISHACPLASAVAPARALEKALADAGRADLYSIYFSFGSDAIRDESEPALREMAEILQRHADWRLQVAGHTDAAGDDASNLDLSRRRAAAVKDALVRRFAIAAERLTTLGYGEARPVASNETLDGRARNRRVELTRTK
ncbi:MAG: OmpA family protein [Burkholderiales bacterium]|nr:OmpA family protein [Burkholderiales bacterium]